MSPWTRASYLTVLIAAVLLNAVVLYFPVDAAPRLIIGLLLIPIILWAGIRYEVASIVSISRMASSLSRNPRSASTAIQLSRRTCSKSTTTCDRRSRKTRPRDVQRDSPATGRPQLGRSLGDIRKLSCHQTVDRNDVKCLPKFRLVSARKIP